MGINGPTKQLISMQHLDLKYVGYADKAARKDAAGNNPIHGMGGRREMYCESCGQAILTKAGCTRCFLWRKPNCKEEKRHDMTRKIEPINGKAITPAVVLDDLATSFTNVSEIVVITLNKDGSDTISHSTMSYKDLSYITHVLDCYFVKLWKGSP